MARQKHLPRTARQPRQTSEARAWPLSYKVALLLLALTCALYLPAVDHPMVFDDTTYLRNNPVFTDPASFTFPFWYREFLNKPATLGLDSDLALNFALRPVAYATFYLNYLFDGFEPRWYRIVNILIHAANATLIYGLLISLLKKSPFQSATSRLSPHGIALVTALLFAVHPMATESVTYIVQRFTSLAAFFYLLALGFQMKSWQAATATAVLRWKAAALVTVLLGMMTKECTVTAPIMLLLLDTLVIGTPWKHALRRNWQFLLTLPVIPLQVLAASHAQNSGILDLQHTVNITNLSLTPFDHADYLISQITVAAHYLQLLLWPDRLNLDTAWPVYTTLFQAPVLIALVVLTLPLILAAWLLHRSRQDIRTRLGMAGILWYFITLFPSSGLVPLPDLVAEHRAYLPSLGIFVALIAWLDLARQRLSTFERLPHLAPGLASLLILGFSLATWMRNDVWAAPMLLWQDATAKSPASYRAWNNLGTEYTRVARYDESIHAFERAKELKPEYEVPYLNLMLVHNRLKNYQQAADQYEALAKRSAKAAKNVHVLHEQAIAIIGLGRVGDGATLLHSILETDPKHHAAHIVLGALYFDNKHYQQALDLWNRASALKPPDPGLAQLISHAQQQVSLQASAP